MSHLLAPDVALRLFRGHHRVVAHAAGHAGAISLSAVTVFDLHVWVFNPRTPSRFASLYPGFIRQFQIREVTARIADEAAALTRFLAIARRARSLPHAVVAATALEHQLTLVTHDQAPFAAFPGLAFEDWTVP